MTIVMKFGGTSVADGEKMKTAAALVSDTAEKDDVVVVTSAMAGITDLLLDTAKNVCSMKERDIVKFVDKIKKRHLDAASIAVVKNIDKITSAIERRSAELTETLMNMMDTGLTDQFGDRVASFGEKFSSAILCGAISDLRHSDWHHGDNDLIVVDTDFINPEPDMAATKENVGKRIVPQIKKGIIPVITGYMGCTHDGQTTTLGRGSSDLISSIVGACLDAEEIQIWTDVDGILTADPKVVPDSKLIPSISFSEAGELAYFGAKVLHPKTLLPAVKNEIPVRILNTQNPSSTGTVIFREAERTPEVVKAVTSKKGVTMLDIVSTKMLAAHGFLAKVFEIFGRHGISIDMVSTTEVSVSLTIDSRVNGRMKPVMKELRQISDVRMVRDKALVCVVGDGMRMVPGTAGRIFSCLGRHGINVECISQGASEVNISSVVDERYADEAVRVLHDEFFPEAK